MSAPDIERPSAGTSQSAPPGRRRTIRPLMMRLHFYAGILVAPFILIAAITGGLYAVAPAIEQIVYRDYLSVDYSGAPKPVADQIRAAQQVRPDLTVSAVRPAPEAGDTTRVLFTDPTLGESERLAVFVDPSTAQPVGELTVYGSSSALPMRTWISQLHRHLHLGEPGRIYSELATSWLWVIALGGLYLWWDRYRKAKARNTSARLLTVDRTAQGRARTVNWHGAVGAWIAVGLVFLSATGLTWSKYAGENVSDLRTALSWTTPSLDKTLDAGAVATGGGGHEGHGGGTTAATDTGIVDTHAGQIDSVLTVARENGVDNAVEASIPADASTAFAVAETRQPWVMSADSIAVDGTTGQVTDQLRFADWPIAAKLTAWGIQLHMGLLFGLLNQLALAALAVALVTVIVRGYVMWWRRRPTRGSDWAVGRAPLRGALRQTNPAFAVAVVAVAVAVGWFMPLLGLSLLGFLVVDAVLGLRARLRA